MFELPGKGLACELAGVFDKVPQDAEMASVNDGVRFIREHAGDAIVALGGGSVLDFAKGVKYLLYKGGKDIRALMPGNMAIVTWPKAELIPIPHVAINTTAGTGVVLEEPRNVRARNDMLGASAMAIISFFYSGMSQIPVHNFAHAFGGKYRVPHGYANGVFLAHVMEAMPELYLPKIKDIARAFDLDDLKKDPEALLGDVVSRIRQLKSKAGIPEDLKEYSIPQSALDDMTKAVMMDISGILFPIPEEIIRKVIRKVI